MIAGQLYTVREEKEEETSSRVLDVIHQFTRVFEEPKRLSLPRSHDHQIPLKEGSQPLKIRAYKCPFIQKTNIEKLVQEMLESGKIPTSSNSPFASQSN